MAKTRTVPTGSPRPKTKSSSRSAASQHERQVLAALRGKATQQVDDDALLAPASELAPWRAVASDA